MPVYFYTAQSEEGETEAGTLSAKDTRQLAQMLKKKGLVLIEAVLEEEKEKKKERRITIPLPLGGVSLTDKMMFTKNLEVMISSGLPLTRALNILSNQAKNKKLKNALLDIRERVNKGKTFSESLAQYPDIFSDLFQNMIKVGEESGTLEDVLKMLSLQLEREHDLRSKVTGAMIYPAVVISAMIGVGILMLVMVVPQIAATFEELNVELPATTQFIITVGVFLAERWYLLIVGFILLVITFSWVSKTERGEEVIDALLLRIPVISSIVRQSNAAVTVRTLSSLISAGVPIVISLGIVSGTLGNIYFKRAMADASERVRKGAKLSEVLKSYEGIFPLSVIQMIEVGEETGQTSKVLARLADFFEEEVGAAAKNLVSLVEPIIMIIIGAAIGFFAVSMVQPMYSMLEGL
jgi:type IV pilus assembly protein PilC